MSSRFVNLALFFDSLLLLASGLLLLETARPTDAWLYTFHRFTGAVLLVLLLPKTRIIWRSLLRQVRRRSWLNLHTLAAVALTVLLAIVLFLALAWTLNLLPFYLDIIQRVTPLGLHWYLAFPLVPFFAWHAWKRWPLRRPAAILAPPSVPRVSRRTALRVFGLGVAGIVVMGALEEAAGRTDWVRRFTGSREISDSSPSDFPVTSSDAPPAIDLATWRLCVTGRVMRPLELSYADLLALASVARTATIDCTLGWASEQDWQGVPLTTLLERAGVLEGANELTCRAVTGYYSVLSLSDAGEALLSTHVGGLELAPDHGFPARLVLPAERGYRWVKWVSEIEVQ